MSRIQALDEITGRLGTPAFLRWVDAPCGAAAAIARFRHRGATVDLSASHTFRLIFHLSSSQVVRRGAEELPSQDSLRTGSIIASFTHQPEQIRIVRPADTLHLLFSPELAKTCSADKANRLSPRTYPGLQAGAVQALVAIALNGTDAQLHHAIGTVARTLADNRDTDKPASGGLTPQATRAFRDVLEKQLRRGVSVPELAEAAGLSLHHFIKTCRHSEGFTPHALVTQRRIEQAIALLLKGKTNVEEIAIMLGFSSPSHFTSTFRKLVGVTPALLRRAART